MGLARPGCPSRPAALHKAFGGQGRGAGPEDGPTGGRGSCSRLHARGPTAQTGFVERIPPLRTEQARSGFLLRPFAAPSPHDGGSAEAEMRFGYEEPRGHLPRAKGRFRRTPRADMEPCAHTPEQAPPAPPPGAVSTRQTAPRGVGFGGRSPVGRWSWQIWAPGCARPPLTFCVTTSKRPGFSGSRCLNPYKRPGQTTARPALVSRPKLRESGLSGLRATWHVAVAGWAHETADMEMGK